MAEAGTNWIDFLVSLTPVAQTGIWAGVALVTLLTLRRPLKQFAEELVRRVNQGDNVSTPWLSLEKKQDREREVVKQVTENIRTEIRNPSEGKAGILPRLEDDELDALLENVRSRFVDLIFPTSEFRNETGKDVKTALYVTNWSTVSDFSDDAYIAAAENGVTIPAYTYDSYWHFKNTRTGNYVLKVSPGQRDDVRPFAQLNVSPGDVLIAERIK